MNDYKIQHNHHQVNKLMEIINKDNLINYIDDLMNEINDKDVDHVQMKIHNEIQLLMDVMMMIIILIF
jgi:hypothetical protein